MSGHIFSLLRFGVRKPQPPQPVTPPATEVEEKPFELKPVEAPTAPDRSIFDPEQDT